MSCGLMTPSRPLVRTRWVSAAFFLGKGGRRVKGIRGGRSGTAVETEGKPRMDADGHGWGGRICRVSVQGGSGRNAVVHEPAAAKTQTD